MCKSWPECHSSVKTKSAWIFQNRGKLQIFYPADETPHVIRNVSAHVLRSERDFTIMPGDYESFVLPSALSNNRELAIVPKDDASWPSAELVHSVGREIRLSNHTSQPVAVRKHEHLAYIRHIISDADLPPASSMKSNSFTQPTVEDALDQNHHRPR
jgi:hypothetical protein